AVGDVVPRQPGARPADIAPPRPGARAAQQARRRRGRIGADRRDHEGGFPADLASQARIHGAREGDLGGAQAAQAQARGAVVRVFAGRVVERAGARGRARGERRLLRDREDAGQAPAQRREDEHRGARTGAEEALAAARQAVANRRHRGASEVSVTALTKLAAPDYSWRAGLGWLPKQKISGSNPPAAVLLC